MVHPGRHAVIVRSPFRIHRGLQHVCPGGVYRVVSKLGGSDWHGNARATAQNCRGDLFRIGSHAPHLTPRDLELLHQLWLELNGRLNNQELHHNEVVYFALKEVERELAQGDGTRWFRDSSDSCWSAITSQTTDWSSYQANPLHP
jgi:hypothetical protein